MHAAKTLGWAGATPLLTAFSRPNQSGVAPARHQTTVTVFFAACIQRCKQTDCGVQTATNLGRRKFRWQF
jgi:hypothetical protein